MSSRLWNIVLHRHEDASFTARVWVDGKLLLPDGVACSAVRALAHVEGALVDVRGDDQLAVRTQSAGGIRNFRPASAALALRWLAERIADERRSAEGPPSGTGTIVRPGAVVTGAERGSKVS